MTDRGLRLTAALAGVLLLSSCVTRPPVAPGDIELRQLADGVWLHTSHYVYPGGSRFPSNGLLVRDGDGLTLVDTAWGEQLTMALLAEIDSVIGLPVQQAVITHFHGDRSAGADALEQSGIPVFAQPLTRTLTMANGLPVPDLVLDVSEPGEATRLGNVEIYYPGAGHSRDNLVVWLPAQRVLFGGCAVRALAATTAGNTRDGDIGSWLQVMDDLRDRYAAAGIVVPGHGEPGDLRLLDHTRRLLQETDP